MIPYIRKPQDHGAAHPFGPRARSAKDRAPQWPTARTEASPDLRRERSPVLTFVMLAAAALLIIGVFGSGAPF